MRGELCLLHATAAGGAAPRKPLTERALGAWLRTVLLATVLVTLAVSALSLGANFVRWELNERVQHAHRDVSRIHALSEAVSTYVTELRGYVLFGDRASRTRLGAAHVATTEAFEALHRAEAAYAGHGDALQRLEREIGALFAFHDGVIALVGGTDHRLAEERLRGGEGLERVAAIRGLLQGMRLDEEQTLARQDADSAGREVLVWRIALAALLAQLLLVALGLLVLRRELRERAGAVRTLEASEAMLRATFEQSAVGIAHISADRRILRANRRLAQLLGYSVEQLAGTAVQDLSHPEDREAVTAERERLYAGEVEHVTAEKRYLCGDGEPVWMRVTVSLARDSDGVPEYEIAVFEDISAERRAAAELRRFRAALDASGNAVFIFSRSAMKTVDVNDAACRMLGYSREELVGAASNVGYADPAMTIERQAALFDEAIASTTAVTAVERVLQRKDGATLPVELHRSAVVIDGEQYLVGVAHDISARLAAQKALEESESRYRKLVDATPDAVFVSRDGKVAFVNDAGVRLFGARDASELLGRPTLDLVHPDSRPVAASRLRAFAEGAKSQPRMEQRYLHLDGTPFDVEAVSVRFRHDGARAVLSVACDITERKRAGAALLEAKERMDLAIEASGAAIWDTDLRTGEVYLSEGWGRMLGEEPKATRTTLAALMAITHPDDLERVAAASLSAMRADSPEFCEEHRVRARSGEWIWVRTGGRVIERDANGRALRMTGTNFDVTRDKREERLLALEHAVSRCIAEAGSASSGLRAAIRAICESENWEAGRYFYADEAAGLLRFGDSWSTPGTAFEPFMAMSPGLTFARGAGMAGRVWESGEPIWVPDVTKDSRVRNLALASQSSIRSAFVFPVASQARTIGVMATFSRELRQPDERLLAAVRVIGSQLGQFLQRKQAEERLARHAQRQERVARFGEYAIGETDLERLFDAAARAACGEEADVAMLLELSGTGEFVVRAASGESAEGLAGKSHPVAPDSMWERLLESNTTQIVGRDYLASRPVRSPWRAWIHEMGSAIYVPVRGDPVKRMLCAYSRRDHAFAEDDARHAAAIGHILSTALRRRGAEERLAYLAQFDALSGLPNRNLFRDRLEQALAQAARNQWQVGLLFVDLDQFKWVNDTLGHALGDELLKEAAARLQACLRSGDTVARLGGDEFAVVLPDLESPEAAGVVAEKMLAALKVPFRLAGQEIFLGASIGITVYPPDAADADTLLRYADVAMYRAKDAGRNGYQFFTQEMNAETARKLALEKDLRRALERGEFELHYQPKADVTCATVTSAEALLRWRRADGTLVPPGEFISVLEDTGLIAEAGDWVIGEACRQMVRWNGSLPRHLSVAVNVSARQFRGGQLLESVKKALTETGCAPERLQIEITESTVMHDVDVTIETLQALRAMGVQVAVDDFGTGYSSLAYLKRLPIDVIKIDRAFIKDLSEDANDAAIATAIIAMARSLGYRVVAEGVETPLQRQFLEAYGCDEIQGYLLSRPLPAAEFAQWLAERERQVPVQRGGAAN